MAAQSPQRRPQYLQPAWAAMSWAQRTEGEKGKMVKIKTATYLPRFEVGAISEVAASAVSSLMPAPTPASAIPAITWVRLLHVRSWDDTSRGEVYQSIPMKMFISFAVELTIIPSIMKAAPMRATYLRPRRSEREPTNGHTPARARRLAKT